ncbi:hypothetical protein ABZ746_24765 [Streptomyces sp. NPDC020096]
MTEFIRGILMPVSAAWIPASARIASNIASRGALWFTAFTGKFTARVLTTFLDRLAPQVGRRVQVIAEWNPLSF